MKIYIFMSGTLFACLSLTSNGQTTTYFDCFKDRCERGKQYCVPARERCYHCGDMKEHCGTRIISRDCDSYCMGLNLKNVGSRLDSALKENENLQQATARLQMSQDNLTNNLEALKEENRLLAENEIDSVKRIILAETTQNESRNNYIELENRYKELEVKYKDHHMDHLLIAITALAICLAVIFGILFVRETIKVRRRKLRDLRRKHTEPTGTEVRREGETSVLIPDIIKDPPDGISTASTGDSAAVIDNDDCDDITTNCQETSVDERETESEVRGVDDNCLRKDTPAALKGIQPCRNSVDDLSPKICIY